MRYKRIKITRLKPPCEIMVREVLPAIRAEMARLMILEYGMRQQDVAIHFGVSNAAVSQYMSSKRGGDTDFSDDVKEEIRNFAQVMINERDNSELINDFCDICKHVQITGWLHRQQVGSSSEFPQEKCKICLDRQK